VRTLLIWLSRNRFLVCAAVFADVFCVVVAVLAVTLLPLLSLLSLLLLLLLLASVGVLVQALMSLVLSLRLPVSLFLVLFSLSL